MLNAGTVNSFGTAVKGRDVNDRNRDIITRAQDGDTGAFREIIDLYGPRIYRIAYQTAGNEDDARDIAQEVFIRLHVKLKTFRHSSAFTTWLYRMTVNLSIDYLRKYTRRNTVTLDDDDRPQEIADTGNRPDEHAERNELKGIIANLTTHLTPYQRKVFVLRDFQDFSTAEISDIMKCSESTVRVHLAAARNRIRNALMKHYPNLAARYAAGGE
jgi:RNA polymerase sigma-70 factor (ECF subfamily)